MIIVYVIHSEKDGYRYVGITKNIKDRLRRHNAGSNVSTKGHLPFKIALIEKHKSYERGATKRDIPKIRSWTKIPRFLKINKLSPGGETGRRARFRYVWGNPWEFKSPPGHTVFLSESSSLEKRVSRQTEGHQINKK